MRQTTQLSQANAPAAVGMMCAAKDADVEMLPEELITAAVKLAKEEGRQGRLIPNEKVYDLVADRLGWK